MKLLVLLLLVAVLGKVNSMPRQGPYLGNRQVLYRMEDESEEEEDDIQDDTGNKDESSEEWVNDPNPPDFTKLFPTAPLKQQQHRQKTQGGPGPNGEAFLTVQQEILQTGWKNADKRHRLRTNSVDAPPKFRAFRNDESEESDEDEEEEEEEEEERRLIPLQSEGPGPLSEPPPQARGFPGRGYPIFRRYRAGGIALAGNRPGYYNRPSMSYAQRPPMYHSSPARLPIRYVYVPRSQMMSYPSRVQGPMRYPQTQSRPVMPAYNRAPVSYNQRQPVSMYNRRQFYQVPVKMSLPVRRYRSPAVHSSQNFYRGPVGLRRQRQYNNYNRNYNNYY